MFLYPQNLRGGESCQRVIAGDLDQLLASKPVADFVALRGCALIIPQEGGAQDLAFFIQQNQPVHLPRQADAFDQRCIYVCFCKRLTDTFDSAVPPQRWRLFTPQWLGRFVGIFT